ncbi:MAG: hypothetical protein Q4D21_05905 [Phascolarctobacterium sp.]|nr:hypothetical protein [Phascolarctobacterium sp.]
MQREKLQSRLGFIMLSAASAIGIGVPLLTMEFSVGRGSQRSPMESFRTLEAPGSKWHLHG